LRGAREESSKVRGTEEQRVAIDQIHNLISLRRFHSRGRNAVGSSQGKTTYTYHESRWPTCASHPAGVGPSRRESAIGQHSPRHADSPSEAQASCHPRRPPPLAPVSWIAPYEMSRGRIGERGFHEMKLKLKTEKLKILTKFEILPAGSGRRTVQRAIDGIPRALGGAASNEAFVGPVVGDHRQNLLIIARSCQSRAPQGRRQLQQQRIVKGVCVRAFVSDEER